MPRNYKTFFAICKTHGFDYKDKVYEYTEGRTDSLSSLSDKEFNELESMMKELNAPARKNFKPLPGDDQRKKIISIARQMRWTLPDPKNPGEEIADLERIDNFLLKYGKYKKKLNSLTVEELGITVTVLEEKVLKTHLEGLA